MLFLSLIFHAIILLHVNGQSCPKIPDHPCTPVENWDSFVDVMNFSGPNDLILCRFNIQKPIGSSALVIADSVTVLCLEPGHCIINTAPYGERGILKIKGHAKATFYGFVFQASRTSIFNKFSAVHITFGTLMKQTFYRCTFRG